MTGTSGRACMDTVMNKLVPHNSFIHSFIHLCSIDHTDVEFVSKYKYKYKQFVLNIGIGRHQLYTNAISDKDIHVITEHKFSTFPFISSTYKDKS